METLAVYDEYSLRRLVAQTFATILGMFLLIILALLFIRPGWMITFWILVGLVFTTDLIMDFFILRVEKKLLPQLKEYLSRIRYFFSQTHMIDEASYEAINHVGTEMKIQAQKIHNTLISVNPEEEQKKYEEIAPNRFLKVISGLMVLVKEKGDVVDKENPKKGTAFSRGLSSIIEELNLEITFRSKLAYRLKFTAIVTLIPIFMALPVQAATVSGFPVMSKFYESRIGFIITIGIYAYAVVMYFISRKLKGISEVSYKSQADRMQWEKWLIEKIGLIRLLVKIITPNPSLKSYVKKQRLIKDANEPLKVEWLTLRQFIFSFSIAVLLFGGLIFSHSREAESALYNIIPSTMLTSNISEDEYLKFEKDAAFDREMIEYFQSKGNFTMDAVKMKIAEKLGADDVADPKVKDAYERIAKKYYVVENAYFKWYELILVLLVGILVWNVPIFILYFQRYLRKKDMENEVHQFLTIISILRNFDNMSVYTLLEWLERFSVTFKEPLQKAILNFDSGPDDALEELGNEITFEAFGQIVERLKLSVARLSIKEAFEDIELEREFYLEQRKEFNERSLQTRTTTAYFVAYSPAALMLGLYIVIPLFYMSMTNMQSLINKI